jgi:hypothetical protein
MFLASLLALRLSIYIVVSVMCGSSQMFGGTEGTDMLHGDRELANPESQPPAIEVFISAEHIDLPSMAVLLTLQHDICLQIQLRRTTCFLEERQLDEFAWWIPLDESVDLMLLSVPERGEALQSRSIVDDDFNDHRLSRGVTSISRRAQGLCDPSEEAVDDALITDGLPFCADFESL